METLKIELKPIDGRKSFYGNAYYQEESNGQIVLYSYLTPVAHCVPIFRKIYLPPRISNTTDRHIRAFFSVMNAEYGPLDIVTRKK
jgi:hypothetical protein